MVHFARYKHVADAETPFGWVLSGHTFSR